jgi:hypothetical protein
MSYYQQQLSMFNKPGSTVKIQLSGENLDGDFKRTNCMDLNLECIQAMREFLDVIEAEL